MTATASANPALIRIEDVSFYRLQTRTRFPFRYGIASMTDVPHLFARVRVVVNDSAAATGIASEGLPPKWFTKTPDTIFESHDLPEMLRVIAHSANVLRAAAPTRGAPFFEIWEHLYQSQAAWALKHALPPLLANLGVALMERAVLDALCRALAKPAWQAVHDNTLGISLEQIDASLAQIQLNEILPGRPSRHVIARHTVGLGDPLTNADIPVGERISDGLPHALEDCIRTYGLRHFKIKICGDPEIDVPRLRTIASLLARHAPADFAITLDGNEQFSELAAFREEWDHLRGNVEIARLFTRLRFVEQPLHRDAALDASVREELNQWPDAPRFIIDESDAELASLPRALELGYSGGSHKNCKGIIKGLANAARLAVHGGATGRETILSGEDLANLGPVALLQDLAMVAMLGIDSVERNGHHYFRGLSMYPKEVQQSVLECHPDLYHLHPDDFAALTINDGQLALGSVNDAPFGAAVMPDLEEFAEPLELSPRRDVAHP